MSEVDKDRKESISITHKKSQANSPQSVTKPNEGRSRKSRSRSRSEASHASQHSQSSDVSKSSQKSNIDNDTYKSKSKSSVRSFKPKSKSKSRTKSKSTSRSRSRHHKKHADSGAMTETNLGDSTYATALRGANAPTYSIFVKNLSRDCTDEELGDLFSKYGSVYSAKVIRKKDNLSNKCFGFVNFTSKEAQKQALQDSGSSDLVLHGNYIECALSANTTVVYIGNISPDVEVSDIRYHIRKFGGSYLALHLRSGHAFVVYDSYYCAEKAIDCLNGTTVGGCKLWANVASETKSRPIKQLMNFGSEPPNARSLFIGNLSHTITEDGLKDRFGKYGKVTDVRIPKIRPSGKSRGFAFVEFANSGDAEMAIRTEQGKKLLNQTMDINWCRDDPRMQMPDPFSDPLVSDRTMSRLGGVGTFDYRAGRHGSTSDGGPPSSYMLPSHQQFPHHSPSLQPVRYGQNYPIHSKSLKTFPLMELPGKPGQYVHLIPAGYVSGMDVSASPFSSSQGIPGPGPGPEHFRHGIDELHISGRRKHKSHRTRSRSGRRKEKNRHDKHRKQKHEKKSSSRRKSSRHRSSKANSSRSRSRNRSHSRSDHSRSYSRSRTRSRSQESESTRSSKSKEREKDKDREREREREKERERDSEKHNKDKERDKKKERDKDKDKDIKKYKDSKYNEKSGQDKNEGSDNKNQHKNETDNNKSNTNNNSELKHDRSFSHSSV